MTTAYDDGFFSVPQGVLAVAVLVIVGAIFLIFPHPGVPPPPPPAFTGCYAAQGGPDIAIDLSEIRVLQNPPVKVAYELQFIKGWVLSIGGELNYKIGPDGKANIFKQAGAGEFIRLSRELEVSSPESRFELIDRQTLQALEYVRVGNACKS